MMERLVDPAIADLQAEYEEALRSGPNWRSRWIWFVGHLAFFRMLVVHGCRRTTDLADRPGNLTRTDSLLAPLRGLSLDVRIALRLLVKHIGLTVVGTVAMAFAICVGMLAFEFFIQVVRHTASRGWRAHCWDCDAGRYRRKRHDAVASRFLGVARHARIR